ncbi:MULTISPECIES: TonB-dependent receptor [unclassified Neisseria]|uniref:TonB-dependent receptor domain-containing protein n=1 Tax=unclassified Neisseria TaxID=2623750 RepID=UPI0026654B21|nr:MULTISPECIES: TonB-dependent receptor [unclassified Neisseria]MDO1509999.1 TonB-dependent receptor [Neisseria sp. MVDL19-042950]MDO1516199.1 TonB-dependent receptor [Neisseria sp. MVDL18-041461]MDO1563314.1 TonB-dependent receptor [Neisseria sp. MVDL20-010259]
MKKYPLKTIVVCLSVLWCTPHVWAAGEGTTAPVQETTLDTVEVKGTRTSKDEKGHNRVYAREVVNLYKGKQEVETFKGNTVSDLFSGLVGVYSGDARNSGALDPNIRGVQGQGRVPVTVDGTEQAITVWRGYTGANNRNYVDPNIISSVYIEKGPSFSRDAKSGIGGTVALKTIDADDIVPQGQKYGLEFKAETSTNSVKPRRNVYEKSVDYRTLPYPEVSTGGIWRALLDDTDRVDQRFGGRNKFFEDKAYRIAAATKQENFDAIIAYAYRNKGNYFSGKKGAQRYGYIGPWTQETLDELKRRQEEAAERGESFFGSEGMGGAPDIAKIGLFYHPGGEVSNTSLETKSWLGKTTFRLPNHQTLKFGLRHTNTVFGEIMPSRIIGPISLDAKVLNKIAEWPDAWVKQKSYNIDYTWKPEGNRWIDFNASLWTTRTKSKTNTAGGSPGDTLYEDLAFHRARDEYNDWQKKSPEEKRQLIEAGFQPPLPPTLTTPNTDGRFNTVEGQALYARNNRTGFHFSNLMRLHDKLTLTLLGDFQHEKLTSRDNFSEVLADGNKYQKEQDNNTLRPNYQLNEFGVPRNGKRREYNLGFNFKYDPVRWLSLTAGARYTHFSIQDQSKLLETGLNKYGRSLEMNRGIRYTLGRVATEQEYKDYLVAQKAIFEEGNWTPEYDDAYRKISIEEPSGIPYIADIPELTKDEFKNYYWNKDQSGRLDIKNNPLTNGSIPDLHTQVVNPAHNPSNPFSPRMVPKYSGSGSFYNTEMTDAERRRARKQSDSGWAPAFSATVNFTDNARAYLRYTESLRFPSMFEGTYGFSTAAGTFARAGYGWKPEHAKNWEVGYIHDLTGFFPKMRHADFRINYFHNKTKNVIDRDENLEFEQFDKHTRTGVELQARFDTGRFFGGIGVLRNLKNEMCDDSFGLISENDEISNYIKTGKLLGAPNCNHGGLSDSGYLATALQPRWSIDADLGGRFLKNKLETGVRMHYHSRVYQSRKDAWWPYFHGRNRLSIEEGQGNPKLSPAADDMRWQPVAVWDAYLRYKISKNFTAELVGTNLTDRYYLDPMSRSYLPAPGRGIRVGISGKF